MTIVLLSSDLMVVSRVAGAATEQDLKLQTAANLQQAVEACRNHLARMLIIDLAAPSLDVAALVAATKGDNETMPTVVAFGPHVHEDRLAAAREAGCDRVISRGQFMGQLDTLLQL